MKWLYWVGSALAVSVLALTARQIIRQFSDRYEQPEPDGGIRHYSGGTNAPKVIRSTEIIEFNCEFSLLASCEPQELENRVYQLHAAADSGHCSARLKWYDHNGDCDQFTLEASSEFMEQLQEIVTKHNLAKHNGYCHEISGLPDMYGSCLDIFYAGGESIYAYDNQDCFLSQEVMTELVNTFTSYHTK